jgi:hypothetical protein
MGSFGRQPTIKNLPLGLYRATEDLLSQLCGERTA